MNMRQVWGVAGGFLGVYVLITLTNRPAVHPRPHAGPRTMAEAQQMAGQRQPGLDNRLGEPVGRGGQAGAAPPAAVLPAGFQRGVCLLAPGASGLKQPANDRAFEEIGAAGGSWVAICPALTQETATSSAVTNDPLDSPTTAALTEAIAHAHARHLSVMLRPRIVARDGAIPETFGPNDPAAWLDSYRAALSGYVDLAKQTGVELVCLGGPYSHLERAAGWHALIQGVRARYPGKLTYAAATADDRGEGGFQQVPFWGELDYVGIDAFGPVTGPPNASDGNAIDASRPPGPDDAVWQRLAEAIQTWLPANANGKQVLFTSVGIPADNPATQARATASFFQALSARPWLAGAYWLGWDAGDTRAAGIYAPIGAGMRETIQSGFAR